MTLGQKQEKFANMLTKLMVFLHNQGYTMRGGHWLRCQDCHIGAKNSVHKAKLALDINLTLAPSHDERPRLLTGRAAQKAHEILHDYWETMGGAKRIPGDLNHYSLEHNGMR